MFKSTLTTLGGFSFRVNGISSDGPATRKARALMTFLIMNRHTESSRERLLEIFWPDADPNRARDSLKTALWSIRRCLRTAGVDADEFILATRATLRWKADTSVDALRFAELAARNDSATAREALELFHGDFLEGDYDNWAVAERERLAALYETLLGRIVRTSKDTQAAQLFIARNPYDEEAYVALIEAELAAGRRSSAASWVERCRKALSELGEKPSANFEARFGNVVHIEPVVSDDLSLPFAGRDAELGLLAARIHDASLGRGSVTLVHGEAGIGKSTLLSRAGYVAREHSLRVLHIRCAGEAHSTFGPWQGVFNSVEAGDFEAFVRSHGANLITAVAYAIAAQLPAPTLVIADDAHELTGDALGIFIALAGMLAAKHAVVAGLRPEGVAPLRSHLTDVPFEEIVLGRLDRTNLKWALAQALGTDQPDVLDVLYDRTSGHPLFFTGLLNSLISGGALSRDGHGWRLIKRIDDNVELPHTVKRFIETRLNARGDTPRAVACALALEPAAGADDLSSVLHSEESTVLDALDDLLALGLITQPPEGAQFAFTHDLIREVAAAGLNAGRRTALHREFAQRLGTSGGLEASFRLGRHFQAAGEFLAAAHSYLKSAEAALDLNATQDAIERCDAGIHAAEKLERTPRRDLVIAQLHRISARAAIAGGDAEEAIRRAREAVNAARASGDIEESSRTILDLAVMEGAAFQVSEQQSDAAEATRLAAGCRNMALEAHAFILHANAARQLGQRDEAMQAARAADDLARRSGRPDISLAALEELLRTQITWWLFNDALETARVGLDASHRLGQLPEAAFRQVRSALWYLLDRFEEAQGELQAAMRSANEASVHHGGLSEPVFALPAVVFFGHYMAGKIAGARKEWDQVLEAAQRAQAMTNVSKLPRYGEALSLLRIDALLQRDLGSDRETAHELTKALVETSFAQGTIGWSDCVELAKARDAARCGTPGARQLVHGALDTLEENAHRVLLETDRAFDRLARAATEIGETTVARRAAERAKHYKTLRRAAAGAAWGGEATAV